MGVENPYNEELNDLYSSPSIFRVIKSRGLRWAGNVARMGKRSGVYRVWCGTLRERDRLGDPSVDGRIILRWLLRKWDVGIWIGSSWHRIVAGGGYL
jgi:hypothetical protein